MSGTDFERDAISRMRFAGQTALVTGAASGLGRDASLRLAREGAHVVLGDIDHRAVEAVGNEIVTAGGKATPLRLDVSDKDAVDSLVEGIEGGLDILMNFAGVALLSPFLEITGDEWRRSLAVNLNGSFYCARACAHRMMQRSYGRIINVASIAGIRAGYARTAYGVTKGAVVMLTRNMAVDLAPHGITVNALAPGPVDTPLVRGAHNPATKETYMRQLPLQRFGRPEEISAAALFLASTEASYITGQVLAVDGGFVAGGVLDGPAWLGTDT